MTKSDKFQTADTLKDQPLKTDEKELYMTYPDDLPNDNIEAALLLMKRSLTIENKQKK